MEPWVWESPGTQGFTWHSRDPARAYGFTIDRTASLAHPESLI
jgi:hypothetical protein